MFELSIAAFLCAKWPAILAAMSALAAASWAVKPVVATGPARRRDAWTVIGPGGGGSEVTAAISPHDPNLMLVAAEMTGTYISRDGGRSWRMINLGQVVYGIAFDPVRPEVIYAGSICVWRSEDTGETWSRIYPARGCAVRARYRGDHAFHVLDTEDPSYPVGVDRVFVTAIAPHPHEPGTIFIAHRGDWFATVPSAVLVSRDGGGSWEIIATLEHEIASAAAFDARASELVFVTGEAVYRWDGKRLLRRPAPQGAAFSGVSLGWLDGTLVIYAAAGSRWEGDRLAGGILVSSDRGETWRDIAGGLGNMVLRKGWGKPPEFRAVVCAAARAKVLYAGFKGLALGSSKDEIYSGVARSSDGGATWKLVRKERRLASLDPSEGYQRRRAPSGRIRFDEPSQIAVAPSGGDVVLASDLFRTLVTRDAGRSWQSASATASSDGRLATRGIDVSVCFGVRFDPFDNRSIYALLGNLGIWNSLDGGATWQDVSGDIPQEWRRCAYWLELDPAVKGLVWAAVSGTHDLPRPKMWRRRGIPTYSGCIVVSEDGGRTWAAAQCETHRMAATHVLLDPASPVGTRTLYACAFGKGVIKSADNGRTWALANAGIEFEEPLAWRLTLSGGTLYLVIARRNEWGEARPSGQGALYRSTDGAEHWERLPLPDGVDGPACLTVDPDDPKRLYLAAWGRYSARSDVGGGLYISADGGGSWRRAALDDDHLYDVTVDPRCGALYAVGFESSAWRSDDRGETWRRIKGYNFKWGHRVTPDPADPGTICIATFGGGIWRGPSTGDPSAVEDVLTPIEKIPDERQGA